MDDLTEYDTCVILTLTFSSDKAFDDPASPVGQQWKSIVASLGNQAGWATFHWGRRVEQPDEVEVFIEWWTYAEAKSFLSGYYVELKSSLLPLLQRSPPAPILVQFRGGSIIGIAPAPEIICSVYRLHYRKALDREIRSPIGVSLSQYAQSICVPFSRGWALPPSSTGQLDPAHWAEGSSKTLFVVIGWNSIEEEESFNKNALGDSKAPGQRTTFEIWLQSVLNHADAGWEHYHVPFDLVFESNLERWKKSTKVTWPY